MYNIICEMEKKKKKERGGTNVKEDLPKQKCVENKSVLSITFTCTMIWYTFFNTSEM